MVSKGAQKCFLEFAEAIGERWESDSDSFGEGYFKDVVARTIAFRWTDSMVARADWYREDRGFKANIVTYTLAWLVGHLGEAGGRKIDLERIWGEQDLSDELKLALERAAPRVAAKIKDAPAEVKNISEYCKRQACWAAVSRLEVNLQGIDLNGSTIGRGETRQRGRERRAANKLDNEVEFDARLFNLVPQAGRLRALAQSRRLLSPSSTAALSKLASGDLLIGRSGKRALKELLDRLADEGIEVPD